MAKQQIMTVAGFNQLLAQFENEITEDFEVWLSSDEEGNEFLPMLSDPQFCLAIDPAQRRIVLFPSHR